MEVIVSGANALHRGKTGMQALDKRPCPQYTIPG